MNKIIKTTLNRLATYDSASSYANPYEVSVFCSSPSRMAEVEEMIKQGLLRITENELTEQGICVFEYTEKGKQYLDMLLL
jgi:hypothetical protein